MTLHKFKLSKSHLYSLPISLPFSELKDRVENVVATPQDVDRTDENQDLVFKLSILQKT